MLNEAEYESFDMFLDDLERDDYVFDKDEVMEWLMENKGGYYSMTTQGLDFSYFDLADELIDEGLISKEKEDEDENEYKKGGSIKDVIVYDNGGESFDRYTIFTPDGSVFGMSENATMPNGFNMYIGEDTEIKKGSHLGKRLKSVPQSIEKAVMNRLNETYAKGGMTEHGLKVGDTIMGESKDLNAVFVRNNDQWHNVFLDKGTRYAKGGGVDGEITLYKVVGYIKASDFDDKKNGFVIADDYITKRQAEDTMYEWKRKKTYPYLEIKEYKGKDPYKKFAKGGGISSMLRNRRGK